MGEALGWGVSFPVEDEGKGRGWGGLGGGVGTGKGTGKSMRTRLSKRPFSKLPFSFSPIGPKRSRELPATFPARCPCQKPRELGAEDKKRVFELRVLVTILLPEIFKRLEGVSVADWDRNVNQRAVKGGGDNSGEGKTYHKNPHQKRFWTPTPHL